MTGPLAGITVVELGGKGPVQFAGMLLADLGARVLLVRRPSIPADPAKTFNRGKTDVPMDLATPDGQAQALSLLAEADAVIVGFRPGVADSLGLGPEHARALNRRLIYGTVTGWGLGGPLSNAPGHDVDFIALSGALDPIGSAGGPPVVPSDFVGSLGGGAMSLAVGVVAAVRHAKLTGEGQSVEASILDGSSLLTTGIRNFVSRGEWKEERASNLLDGGAPFYGVYETLEHRYVSIGALEPQFWQLLLELLGLGDTRLPEQYDRSAWTRVRAEVEAVFRSKTRDEWCDLLEGTDVCFAPVLSLAEAPQHPHNVARSVFVEVGGDLQPAPSPRFSRTQASVPEPLALG